jgi:hypothetical protein
MDGTETGSGSSAEAPAPRYDARRTRDFGIKTKTDIINLFLAHHKFRRYLEISSPTTGLHFAEIDRRWLERCDRVVYHADESFADGAEITWRCPAESLDPFIAEVARAGRLYDLILVDSFHTYQCSVRDLAVARSILAPGGIIVMHDASPPEVEVTVPDFVDAPWAGQSYAALVDHLLLHEGSAGYVVDIDWGVAVIGSRGAPVYRPPSAIVDGWRERAGDPVARFAYFDANRRTLLNLIRVDEFLARERLAVDRPIAPEIEEVFPQGRDYAKDCMPDFLRDLARMHLALGNRAEGRRLLEAAAAERPDGPYIRRLLEELGPPGEGE